MAINQFVLNQIKILYQFGNKKLNLKSKVNWLYPTRWQREYQTRLLNYVDQLNELYTNIIDDKLDPLLQQRDIEFNIDAWPDDLNNLITQYNLAADELTTQQTPIILADIPQGVSNFNREQWDKIINTRLGLQLIPNEPWLESL